MLSGERTKTVEIRPDLPTTRSSVYIDLSFFFHLQVRHYSILVSSCYVMLCDVRLCWCAGLASIRYVTLVLNERADEVILMVVLMRVVCSGPTCDDIDWRIHSLDANKAFLFNVQDNSSGRFRPSSEQMQQSSVLRNQANVFSYDNEAFDGADGQLSGRSTSSSPAICTISPGLDASQTTQSDQDNHLFSVHL